MLKRIALMVSVGAGEHPRRGVLRVANAETREEVPPPAVSFVLTLERDPDASFARGHIRVLPTGAQYSIQGSAALFDALSGYIAGSDTP